jgi:hypothetical protein
MMTQEVHLLRMPTLSDDQLAAKRYILLLDETAPLAFLSAIDAFESLRRPHCPV